MVKGTVTTNTLSYVLSDPEAIFRNPSHITNTVTTNTLSYVLSDPKAIFRNLTEFLGNSLGIQ